MQMERYYNTNSSITFEVIKSTAIGLLRTAVIRLPQDVVSAIETGYEHETEPIAKLQLKTILDNIKLAAEKNIPLCQDTGMIIFYVDVGKLYVENIESALRAGVEAATATIPLRPNAVHPLTRKNPGNNVGARAPYINYRCSSNDYIELTVIPKGAGSENMSKSAMLTPADGVEGIKKFVVDTVVHAGGKPCPPTIIGVGIGGSIDISAKLAKEALLRPLGTRNQDRVIAVLELELYELLNKLGIGPMGLGGKTTVLGVNIEYAYTHTASLPVTVNIQCWAARRATAKIYPDGKVEYVSE